MNDVDRIRQLARELREAPEEFDPELIGRHLDRPRLEAYLQGELVEEVQDLLADPGTLRAVLGEDLDQFIDVRSALAEAAEVPLAALDHVIERVEAVASPVRRR